MLLPPLLPLLRCPCCACACREDWLCQLISELDDSEPYEYVKALTDVLRLHLFDVVMQYRAIFFDSSSSSASSGQVRAASAAGSARHVRL